MLYDPLNYYQLLGVDKNFTDSLLKTQYRDKAKFWHPDHNSDPNAVENFQKIAIAYDVLKDKKSRMIYDLLATIYTRADFPDMKSLKIYKAAHGEETPLLRVFKLQKMVRLKRVEENLIGTFSDAVDFVRQITRQNWLTGWWSPKAFKENLEALKQNYRSVGQNVADNYKLLVHNTAAFLAEDKIEKACLSAQQALAYASPEQREILQRFLSEQRAEEVRFEAWDYRYLQKIQLRIPYMLGGVLALFFGMIALLHFEGGLQKAATEAVAYYQKVRFNSGAETVNDMVAAKVFNIPVDVTDTNMLYHLRRNQKVMHGPSERFDIMAEAKLGQTVRVTGYTTDEIWYRVMLDNGEMGFIKKEHLKKGVGIEIPSDSKIFRNPNL